MFESEFFSLMMGRQLLRTLACGEGRREYNNERFTRVADKTLHHYAYGSRINHSLSVKMGYLGISGIRDSVSKTRPSISVSMQEHH